jgi:hypothetical protein
MLPNVVHLRGCLCLVSSSGGQSLHEQKHIMHKALGAKLVWNVLIATVRLHDVSHAQRPLTVRDTAHG